MSCYLPDVISMLIPPSFVFASLSPAALLSFDLLTMQAQNGMTPTFSPNGTPSS